ncbi:MAG: hypothetical protein GXP54_10115 [Deltaproteobacteria bacterium]|nr:hypothetical protein [Deltaproteobacteria bacterium]
METNDKTPRDVHELLLSEEEESGRTVIDDEEVYDTRTKRPFFTTPVIIIMVVALLTAIGLGVIYSDPILTEQFEALLAGELGEYKEQLRKAQEDRIREIENLTSNKYGSLTLFYSPRDAKVTITEKKFTMDCSHAKGETALLECLRGRMDYSQKPVERQVDNPSLHLDHEKKEIVESIPLNDIPIQEASEDRTIVYRYEYSILIEKEGYYPRTFYMTGDKDRPPLKDVETLFWTQRGPGIFAVDFRGADLMPKPETAKENYMAARKDVLCVQREIEKKRKEGKKISDSTVEGIYLEVLNRHGFKTFGEWNRIDEALNADKEWAAKFNKELKKHKCE